MSERYVQRRKGKQGVTDYSVRSPVDDETLTLVEALVRRHPGSTMGELSDEGSRGSVLPRDPPQRETAVRLALLTLQDRWRVAPARLYERKLRPGEPERHPDVLLRMRWYWMLPLDLYPRGVGKSSMTTEELCALAAHEPKQGE